MRIAYVITRADDIGGAQVHVRDLAEALCGSGHEIMVLAGGSGNFFADLEARGIPHQSIPHLQTAISPTQDFMALLEIVGALRRFRPDVVAAHTAKAGLLGRCAASLLGYPAVFTPHGWSISDRISRRKGKLFRAAETVASKFSSRIINVCDYELGLALNCQVAPSAKMEVIHNGIPDIPEDLRANPEAGPPRLLMIARMAEPKTHHVLLQALARIKHLPWTLDLAGDGPLEANLRSQTKALGLDERVRFLGFCPEPAVLLREAQIFVLSSRSEAFPYSILEAMRAGLPVVASAVGGVSEAVTDSVTGYLTAAGDVPQLAAKLELLISQPSLRKQFGAAGRQCFLTCFTFEQMMQKTLQVYADVASVPAQQSVTQPLVNHFRKES